MSNLLLQGVIKMSMGIGIGVDTRSHNWRKNKQRVVTNNLKHSLIILLIFLFATNYCYAGNFFEERYRGWLWFEEKEKVEILKQRQDQLMLQQKRQQEYAKARNEVEQFSRELEELKFMMIRYPENIEHVRQYKVKEALMLDGSLKLANSFRMVNFLYPETIDLIDNPINLYGRRIKEQIEQNDTTQKLKGLATKIELFLFFSSSCPYCQALEPVLNEFAKKYGFKVEAVSLDNARSKFFKTHHNIELAKKLNLQRTPTIVAVTNDSQIRFELIRGAVSMVELEEAGLLANEYLMSMTLGNSLNSNHVAQTIKIKANTNPTPQINTRKSTVKQNVY